jgi:hypothetical protein
MFALIMQNPHDSALQSYGAMAQGRWKRWFWSNRGRWGANEKEEVICSLSSFLVEASAEVAHD